MKLTKIHLIIILALALILCPILGVCSNMREGYENTIGITEGFEEIQGSNGEDDDEGEGEGEGDVVREGYYAY